MKGSPSVLHVLDSLGKGGTQTSVIEQYHFLSERGLQTKLCVLRDKIELDGWRPPASEDLFRLKSDPRTHLISCTRKFRRLIGQLSVDIVHVHSFFGLLVASVAFPFRRPFLLISSVRNLGYEAWPAKTVFEKVRKSIHGYLIRSSDGIVAVSTAAAHHYNHHLGAAISTVIPDSIPIIARSSGELPKGKKKQIGEELVIALPGRITREKGHQVAIDVIKELRARGKTVSLEILGGGPLHEEVQSHVKNSDMMEVVSISGFLEHDELIARLHQSDICLVPSLQEGFGIVALEAMTMGVPIVASRVGGLMEIIQHGKNGLLCDPEEVGAFVNAIEMLMDSPQLMERLGANAMQSASDRFSIDSIGSKWCDYYRNLKFT